MNITFGLNKIQMLPLQNLNVHGLLFIWNKCRYNICMISSKHASVTTSWPRVIAVTPPKLKLSYALISISKNFQGWNTTKIFENSYVSVKGMRVYQDQIFNRPKTWWSHSNLFPGASYLVFFFGQWKLITLCNLLSLLAYQM